MNHPLAELRAKYGDTDTRIRALQDANAARREQAQQIRNDMEAAALANNIEEMRARMEDLQVLDSAFRGNLTMQGALQVELHEMANEIVQIYQRAKDGIAPVDWAVTVDWRQRALCSQWGGSTYRDGKVCLIDVELCAPELGALSAMLRCRVTQEGNRLRVMENEYQGVCWRDLCGDRIVRHIAPLLDKSRSPLLQVAERVEALAVLA